MAVRPVYLFAAIDVGSFELTMKIYEISVKKGIREVECLETRLALGSDTYKDGKISNEKVEELCRVLAHFAEVMKSYQVEGYRAYGTSAIRETENYAVLLDKIEQRTGIRIEILSNSEQRFLDYKSVAFAGEEFQSAIAESAAILDIGGGSIQISLFDNETLVSTQNLRLGVLRIKELADRLGADDSTMEIVTDELVSAQLSVYRKLFLKNREIRKLIIIDDYISPWANARKEKLGNSIEKPEFEHLRSQLRSMSSYEVARAIGFPEDKVPLLVISTTLTARVAELMGAQQFWAPGVTLCEGIAYEYAQSRKLLKSPHDFERDIIACAMNIAKRYEGSRRRAETLGRIAGTIFDSMKKIHGLGKRERLYLQIACILHDCGKYISLVDIGERSYDIVMATEIIGLSHMEREIIANVIRFNHSPFIHYGADTETGRLDKEAYLKVAKLTAILRLANSLDRSHKQKMLEAKAKLSGNELILTTGTKENIALERAFFMESADFFEEVYSIRPVLQMKGASDEDA
ncbi:MAG: HD domain-containing protein [Lachnospiraceae bacterium]|nr:HD domain-containing protein [Lachnospiraceae bacterium]